MRKQSLIVLALISSIGSAMADDCGDWYVTGSYYQGDYPCEIAGGSGVDKITTYARQCTDESGNSYSQTTYDEDACSVN